MMDDLMTFGVKMEPGDGEEMTFQRAGVMEGDLYAGVSSEDAWFSGPIFAERDPADSQNVKNHLPEADPCSDPDDTDGDQDESREKPVRPMLSVASVIAMAQSVGCNIPEDLAVGIGKLAMEKLRDAVFMANQFRKHEQSVGLTVDQFAKAERLMSTSSLGHKSCFAGPNFKFIGKSVSVLDEDKLIDAHQTYRKLPKSGNRRKTLEQNVSLSTFQLPNERVQTVYGSDHSFRERDEPIEYQKVPTMSSDTELSSSSDSDNDSTSISWESGFRNTLSRKVDIKRTETLFFSSSDQDLECDEDNVGAGSGTNGSAGSSTISQRHGEMQLNVEDLPKNTTSINNDEEVPDKLSQKSPSYSSPESEDEDSSEQPRKRKFKKRSQIDELTSLLESEDPELAEYVLALRIESLLEKILILNDEDVSDESEVDCPESPVLINPEVENGDRDVPRTESQTLGGEIPPNSLASDESETAQHTETETIEAQNEDVHLGVEWVDYMKVFVSTFLFRFNESDLCGLHNSYDVELGLTSECVGPRVEKTINGTDSEKADEKEKMPAKQSPDITDDQLKAETERSSSSTKNTDSFEKVEPEPGHETEDAHSVAGVNLSTSDDYVNLKKQIRRMKHDFERIIRDISTHGIYQVFSVINCFFLDYMRSKFGHYSITGLRKILDVINASLNCPIEPGDHHLRQMCSMLATMLALPAPCELNQDIAETFMKVRAKASYSAMKIEILAWICRYVSQALEWFTNTCLHHVQNKAPVFHGALTLIIALENAGINVTLQQKWHTHILKFIEGSQLIRSKMTLEQEKLAFTSERNELKTTAEPMEISEGAVPSKQPEDHDSAKDNSDAEWTEDDDADLSNIIEMDGERNKDFRLIDETIMIILQKVMKNYKKKTFGATVHKIQDILTQYYGERSTPFLAGHEVLFPFKLKKQKKMGGHRGIFRRASTTGRSYQTGSVYKANNNLPKYNSGFQESPLTTVL